MSSPHFGREPFPVEEALTRCRIAQSIPTIKKSVRHDSKLALATRCIHANSSASILMAKLDPAIAPPLQLSVNFNRNRATDVHRLLELERPSQNDAHGHLAYNYDYSRNATPLREYAEQLIASTELSQGSKFGMKFSLVNFGFILGQIHVTPCYFLRVWLLLRRFYPY
jgi:hypothetical protein